MNRSTPLTIVVSIVAGTPALAHGNGVETWSSSAWGEPQVLLPLATAGGLYAIGTTRIWSRAGAGRGVRYWAGACFWLGWAALALALVSPLHWLGRQLFAAHMIEHEILIAVAAPLLVLSHPGPACLWALPLSWRRSLGRIGRVESLRALWSCLTDPLVATVLHGIAVWVWHVPALFDAALTVDGLHWLQHASFLMTALFFWWALMRGRARERGYGVAGFYLFVTALHSGFLGILLTIAHRPWYPVQAEHAAAWGLAPLKDQQLAGLVMWVPAGLVYTAAALAMFAVWIQHSGVEASRGGRHGVPAH